MRKELSEEEQLQIRTAQLADIRAVAQESLLPRLKKMRIEGLKSFEVREDYSPGWGYSIYVSRHDELENNFRGCIIDFYPHGWTRVRNAASNPKESRELKTTLYEDSAKKLNVRKLKREIKGENIDMNKIAEVVYGNMKKVGLIKVLAP